LNSLIGRAEGTGQSYFRNIVAVQGGDQIIIGRGDRFLRLHDLDIVGDSRLEAIAGLNQSLIRKLEAALGHSHLVGGGAYVEERGADLHFDLAAKIGQLILALF
jgi:hypothetical protein